MGSHCRALRVTLRVGTLEDGVTSLDHEATWLLGHTEHITFGELWDDEGDLYVDAVLHVSCRYLSADNGTARCTAHGFRGRAPLPRRHEQPRQLGGDRFLVVDGMHEAVRALPFPSRSRMLPVVENGASANPCATARCTTADHKRGAACCRDLQVEIMCTRRQKHLEALVRARRSPYLCKVTRGGDYSIDAEMISACAYLEEGGVNCTLHGRGRADGRPAKPDLCSEWPSGTDEDQVLHPGCVFAKRRRRGS
jgi:hypothetical protein